MKKVYLITSLLFFALQLSMAQEAQVTPDPEKISGEEVEARKSPLAVTTLRSGDAYAKIVYSQPHLRGRQMLGDKVSYGKVWRLGANEATEIFLTADLKIGEKTLDAGAYSVYAIPEKDKWTLIFNHSLGQWGAYGYNEKKDAARVEVPVKEAPMNFEAFTIWFDAEGPSLNMAWGDTWVNVPVSFDMKMERKKASDK